MLGDQEYGGKVFPRLMLHSSKLSFLIGDKKIDHEVRSSLLFEETWLSLDLQLSAWIVALERRQTLFPQFLETEQSLRLLHKETQDLRVDKAGPCWMMGWWKSEAPTEKEIEKIKKFTTLFNQKNWLFQWRPGVNQKHQLEILETGSEFSESHWKFQEGPVQYVGATDRGQNFGLFLDQRKRRSWVMKNSESKKVLNLFAFTCGFSLNAALGKASQVVSVDSFPKYLEWGKENFESNGLDPQAHTYEFRNMGAMEYLAYAKKKSLLFDIIICDPPSFSRNKKNKGVFRVERDFAELISLCHYCLSPGGTLLFSTNYEKWPFEKWVKEIERLKSKLGDFQLSSSPSQWDFEWQNQEAHLKAFFLKKA